VEKGVERCTPKWIALIYHWRGGEKGKEGSWVRASRHFFFHLKH